MGVTLHEGDALTMLATLTSGSVDALVTDPPAGISFMGRQWDHDHGGRDGWVRAFAAIFAECLRVLKPGGHAFVWALPRTSHWTATALEDAGFEIRDVVVHLFGSGFPKSLSVAKASIPRIQSRYGTETCLCLEDQACRELDARNGRHAGHNARCGDSSENRIQRERSEGSPGSVGDTHLSVNKGTNGVGVRELWQTDSAQATGSGPLAPSVLLPTMRGRRSETTGQRDSTLWAGLEEPASRDQTTGQELSNVREDARAKRGGAASSPPEAIPLRRDEPSDESSGAVRVVSSPARGSDDPSVRLDSDRSQARRVILDDFSGQQAALARVCSWCGLPDQDWIDSLTPLGTSLKPASEHWILCRKPLAEPTVAANVLAHGVGGINVDGCRVVSDGPHGSRDGSTKFDGFSNSGPVYGMENREFCSHKSPENPAGRWPANVCLDPEAAAMLDEQSGTLTSGANPTRRGSPKFRNAYGEFLGQEACEAARGLDTGGASRFFYCAKPSTAERNAGLAGMPEVDRKPYAGGMVGLSDPRMVGQQSRRPAQNDHPTVKSIALMRWLCRLITPPGGTVLDCFMGSGTTGCAAVLEGFNFIGIEQDAHYIDLAQRRIAYWAAQGRQVDMFAEAPP